MLEEYLSVQDDKEALLCVEEMNSPFFADELISLIMNHTLDSASM